VRRLVQKSPVGNAQAFKFDDPSGKSPRALCTSKAIINFNFLEISPKNTWITQLQPTNAEIGRIELADLGLKFPLV